MADTRGDAENVGTDVAPAAKSKWPSRIGLMAGALGAIGAVVAGVIVVYGPHPDAVLAKTAEEVTLDVLLLVNSEAYFQVDGSTLRAHESFEGWDVWSGSNAYGSPCLVAIAPAADWVRIECTPAPAELVADTFPYSQSDDRLIRFILDGDTVEAWVYPHAEA